MQTYKEFLEKYLQFKEAYYKYLRQTEKLKESRKPKLVEEVFLLEKINYFNSSTSSFPFSSSITCSLSLSKSSA